MESLYIKECDLVGNSEAILNISKAIKLLEGRDFRVALISGEIGTQKSSVAALLHRQSLRSDRPMLNFDCESSPEEWIERELKSGLKDGFLTNYKGIICLHNVEALTIDLQKKLLQIVERAAQSGDGISLIAITSEDLRKRVKENKFSLEFYEYLSRYHIHMPALRDRLGDISSISKKILKEFSQHFCTQMTNLEPEAVEIFASYNWPGNVRQLGAMLEQAAFYYLNESEFKAEFIPHYLHGTPTNKVIQVSADMKLPKHGVVLEELEKNLLKQALEQMLGNQSRAARLLGISRFALRYRMEKYGLFPKSKEEVLNAADDKWSV